MKTALSLLSIGAHSADAFDRSRGLMADHIARGDWIRAWCLRMRRIHDKVISNATLCRQTTPGADELHALMAERSDVNAEEARKACALLGVKDVYFLGANDAMLRANEAIVRHVASLLRAL